MTEKDRQHDDLERLMADVQACEQAGVFEKTPVDVAAVVEAGGRTARPRLTHRLFVGLQVAACVGLVAGLATLWRAGRPSDQHLGLTNGSGPQVASLLGDPRCRRIETLTHCFSGPAGGALGDECRCVDFDSDGDVDLADYGVFQRAYSQSP